MKPKKVALVVVEAKALNDIAKKINDTHKAMEALADRLQELADLYNDMQIHGEDKNG